MRLVTYPLQLVVEMYLSVSLIDFLLQMLRNCGLLLYAEFCRPKTQIANVGSVGVARA